VVLRQEQIRQRRFLRTFRATAFGIAGRRLLQLANNAIRSERREKFDMTAPGWFRLPIREVYDLTLTSPLDGSMRLIHETLETFRKPMIAPCLLALRVHPLLNHGPASIVGNDEGMKIELEAVLHGGAVDLGHQPACLGKFCAIEAHTLSDGEQFVRGLSRKSSSSAAHVDAKFVLQWSKTAFQGTDYARSDTGRMPVHAHDGTKRLEPKGMSKAAEQLIASVMVHDRFTHHGAETGHAIR
jgi:hypothetical protein